MPSFDIVSKVDLQEVDNAVNQTCKEVDQRYDFKGTHNEIDLEDGQITILASDSYKLEAIVDILKGKLTRRGVSTKCLDFQKEEPASAGAIRQKVVLIQGISKEKGKEIVKMIKGSKLKVQAQITEDEVRVSGKNIDDLQDIMQQLRGADLGVELQFVNMRS
ncbi:MAG: YajQ family cyclic di-GMP-binding protein [Desulfuromonadaceae bacterium]|nr:YajQ family cyclic di-GMP-binding protein [Desulfuromonas sp.]MDY0184413.1 YajQ family cyclic di-GMP-binding protein [Desulfuromonadaceae bacterium]